MPNFGFQIKNESSAEVVLAAPVSRVLGVNKTITVVLEDPNLIESNPNFTSLVNAGIISILQVNVTELPPLPPPAFQLVPGPPGPPGPPGTGGSGGDVGNYACPPAVQVLDLVRTSGTSTVDRANANTEFTMPALGIVLSKSSSTLCVVQYRGEITGFMGLIPDAIYFAATTPGSITNIAPIGVGNVVQSVGIARDPTTLVLDIDDFVIL